MGGIFQTTLESSDFGTTVNLRDGSAVALTSTLIGGTKQALDVNVANSISVGTVDETTFTYGTSTYLTVGGVFQDTSPTLTAGQGGAARLTNNRGLHINLRTAAGVELLGQQTMAASVPVVIASNQSAISVTLASLGSPSGGTAGTSSDLAGLIYNSSPITLTTGQQAALQGDVNGFLKTNDVNSLALNAKASPATGTPTSVTGAVITADQTALASNTARKGYMLYNQSNKPVQIALGFANVSGTAMSTIIPPNTTISQQELGSFTGAIHAMWPVVSTSGVLFVTELT